MRLRTFPALTTIVCLLLAAVARAEVTRIAGLAGEYLAAAPGANAQLEQTLREYEGAHRAGHQPACRRATEALGENDRRDRRAALHRAGAGREVQGRPLVLPCAQAVQPRPSVRVAHFDARRRARHAARGRPGSGCLTRPDEFGLRFPAARGRHPVYQRGPRRLPGTRTVRPAGAWRKPMLTSAP